MKRSKSWLKFLALSVMLLPCFCQSSDVSALKHVYETIPLGVNLNESQSFTTRPLTIRFADSGQYSKPSGFQNLNDINFLMTHSNGQCVYDSWSYGSYDYDGFQTYLLNFPQAYESVPDSKCRQLMSYSNQNVDWGSLPPYVFGTPDLRSLSPYWYSFSHMYLSDDVVDTESGVHYSSTLKFSDIYSVPIHYFKDFNLPLSYKQDVVGDLTAGRSIEFRGVFNFASGSLQYNPDYFQNGYFRVRLFGQISGDDSGTQFIDTFNCNLRTRLVAGSTQIEYSCPYVSPYDFDDIGFNLEIGTSDDYVWFSDDDMTWAGLYVITDNDETPGDPATSRSDVTGGDIESAPGKAHIESFDANWLGSLSDLFSFGFLNPFAPIFNLFSNNDSCAQIPTIAGMIHSDELQVCPWFDSTTRNIVTPVLGLSSMMLIFGFAVHWLGARSGNMFEDSVETDNYSFSNKFRRKR